MIALGDNYRGLFIATVIATKDLPTYELHADGSSLEINLKLSAPVIDNRMCTSDVQAPLLFMPTGWLSTPQGSDVHVDEHNILCTTTPGSYQLDIPHVVPPAQRGKQPLPYHHSLICAQSNPCRIGNPYEN